MWYAVSLIMKSIEEGTTDPIIYSEMSKEELNQDTFEEIIILIRAENEERAINIAENIGKSKEHYYMNKYGQTVFWKFLKVDEVKDIGEEEIGHGTELFYRFFMRDKNDSGPIELR